MAVTFDEVIEYGISYVDGMPLGGWGLNCRCGKCHEDSGCEIQVNCDFRYEDFEVGSMSFSFMAIDNQKIKLMGKNRVFLFDSSGKKRRVVLDLK